MNILFSEISALFISKVTIAVILALLVYHLYWAGEYGRRIFGISNGMSTLHNSMKFRYLAIHQKYAKRAFLIAVLAVVLVELVIRFIGKPAYDSLFWVHLSVFAIPCFTLFGLIRFKYTGLKHPNLHGKLIYRGLLPLLVGTLVTGIPLLYRL
ncbi:MAG: hypothetical protein HYT94_00025 [Parcubacteria group bacterium]|nr:hypothetical protein [Parcubacteria group bacterium]